MIDFENVSKTFGKNTKAVRNVTLHIDKGEFVFVMGDSGSGKSTLIRLLLKEIEPTNGTIIVDGTDITHMKKRRLPRYRRKLGVVFQDFKLLKDLNVYDNVAFAQRVVSTPSRQIRRDVPRILTRVGLSAKYKAYPNELSGGEQQRVAIARALVNRPDILLCDEPTGNLDAGNAWEVMHLLEKFNAEGTTVLMVTHSREIVEHMGKRVIIMSRGDMVDDLPAGSVEVGSLTEDLWETRPDEFDDYEDAYDSYYHSSGVDDLGWEDEDWDDEDSDGPDEEDDWDEEPEEPAPRKKGSEKRRSGKSEQASMAGAGRKGGDRA